jgi:hypothetical protein
MLEHEWDVEMHRASQRRVSQKKRMMVVDETRLDVPDGGKGDPGIVRRTAKSLLLKF